MRGGFIASVTGHLAVLAWGFIALPASERFEVKPVESLSVDLIPIEDVTRVLKGERNAELREVAAVRPTETKRDDAPDPEKTTGEAKVEMPTPPSPRPAPQPVKAPEPPAPAPAPEPAPVKPEPPKPEPVATPPEPAPAPEPEPKAAEAPAEAAPKTAEPTPVKVVPRTKPTPPPKTQTAQRPREDTFNPNQISALLNKIDPSGGGTAASTQPASLGTARGEANVRMSQSELDALRGQISRCWNPPVGAAGADDLLVRLQFQLTVDGAVDGSPRVLNSSSNPSFRAASDSAVRAVMRCAPYSLPGNKYETWKDVIINFDPRELLGG
ncbi:cell envelope integrity protein TolA [Polymorphum gilvum]|uniref:TolA protein n=1 Tax=Polymorphum gilvum (strain LMG 25793 / CGMCC 1.9160 / SL003B-26A1) TaxID=991905 RepID=F2IX61_POLGS|nr:cell envelope integrity protein TolA [Polymorphum gilvum]ADZ69352.1 TolA protein [Polymorphum gilvum SL003B-26A1]